MKRVKLGIRENKKTHGPGLQVMPFGPPSLIEGEDATAYDELLARISTAVKPLNSANLTIDAVIAQTMCELIEKLESIERMLAMIEARRNATLREIDRYRATRSDVLRRTTDELKNYPVHVIDMKSGRPRAQHDQ